MDGAIALSSDYAQRVKQADLDIISGADISLICAFNGGKAVALCEVRGQALKPKRVFNL